MSHSDDVPDDKSLDLMTCLKGHKGAVLAMDFSPTSNLLVSGGEEKTIMLWDLNDVDSSDEDETSPPAHHHSKSHHSAPNISTAASNGTSGNLANRIGGISSGTVLSSRRQCHQNNAIPARGQDNSFFVEKQTTKIIGESERLSNRWRRLEHGNDDSHVLSVSFGASGYFVSGYMNGKAKLWKLSQKGDPDGMPEPSSCQSYSCHQSMPIRSVSCCQTRAEFCTAAEKVVRVWSAVGKNKMLTTFKGHTNHVRCVKWSRLNDSSIGSCGNDGRVCIWDTRIPFKPITEIKKQLQFNSLDWHPVYEYHIATGSRDAVVRVWDLRKNECIQPYDQHTGPVNSVSFNEGGTVLISGSDDKKCKMFDVLEFRPLFTMGGHKKSVSSVCFNKTGDLFATGSHDKSINIYKSNIKSCIIIPDCTEDSVIESNDLGDVDGGGVESASTPDTDIVDERRHTLHHYHHQQPQRNGNNYRPLSRDHLPSLSSYGKSTEKITRDHDFPCDQHCSHYLRPGNTGIVRQSRQNPKCPHYGVIGRIVDNPEQDDESIMLAARDTTEQRLFRELRQMKETFHDFDSRLKALEKKISRKICVGSHTCDCDIVYPR